MNKYNIDINRVLVRPIYIGLLMNIFVPILYIGIAYYLETSGRPEPEMTTADLSLFFWIFSALSVISGAAGIMFKQKRFFTPMIKAKESFEDDFSNGVFSNSIICYAIADAIAVYGLVMYLFGGTFMNLFFFVFLSLIAFQLLRPRYGFLEKVLAAQERYVDEGRFLGKGN